MLYLVCCPLLLLNQCKRVFSYHELQAWWPVRPSDFFLSTKPSFLYRLWAWCIDFKDSKILLSHYVEKIDSNVMSIRFSLSRKKGLIPLKMFFMAHQQLVFLKVTRQRLFLLWFYLARWSECLSFYLPSSSAIKSYVTTPAGKHVRKSHKTPEIQSCDHVPRQQITPIK